MSYSFLQDSATRGFYMSSLKISDNPNASKIGLPLLYETFNISIDSTIEASKISYNTLYYDFDLQTATIDFMLKNSSGKIVSKNTINFNTYEDNTIVNIVELNKAINYYLPLAKGIKYTAPAP